MRSWSVVEKFSLQLSFDFYFRDRYMDRARRRGAGWEEDLSFYYFFFFVNRFVCCFFCTVFLPSSLLNARLRFHVIHPHLIIQHKVSFSSCFISFFLF